MKDINKPEEVILLRKFFNYSLAFNKILIFIKDNIGISPNDKFNLDNFIKFAMGKYNKNVSPIITNINSKILNPETELKNIVLSKKEFTFINSEGKKIINIDDEIHLFTIIVDFENDQIYSDENDLNSPFKKIEYKLEPDFTSTKINCKKSYTILDNNIACNGFYGIKKGALISVIQLHSYSNSSHFNDYDMEPDFITKKKLFNFKVTSIEKDHFSNDSLLIIYSMWDKDENGNNMIMINSEQDYITELIRNNDEIKNVYLTGDIENFKEKWNNILKTGKGEISFSIKGINEK